MSIPSGDAVQRVYAVRRSSAEGGGELVVVEIENASPVPVALALAPSGPTTPRGWRSSSASTCAGRRSPSTAGWRCCCPARPGGSPASTFRDGDSAATVFAGDAAERWRGAGARPGGPGPGRVRLPAGPRRHVPGRHPARSRAAGPASGRGPPAARGRAAVPRGAPPAAAVAAGWQAQSDRGMRLCAARRPPGRGDRGQPPLPAAAPRRRRDHARPGDVPPVLVPRRRLPAAGASTGTGTTTRSPRCWPRTPAGSGPTGSSSARTNEWDTNGAALVALARHWRLTRDTPFVEGIVEPIARGAHWIDRKRRSATAAQGQGPRHDDPRSPGCCPGGDVGRAPRSGRPLLLGRLLGRGRACGPRPSCCAPPGSPTRPPTRGGSPPRMWADVEASLALTAARLGTAAIPAGPAAAHRRRRHGVARRLRAARAAGRRRPADRGHGRRPARAVHARGRARLLPGHQPQRPGHVPDDAARRRRAAGRRPPQPRPPRLDARRGHAHVDVARGDPPAHRRRLHGRRPPRVGRGRGAVVRARPARARGPGADDGEPHPDPGAVLAGARVRGTARGGRSTTPRPPTARVSYAVRWHGDRVALLWEVDPHPGVAAVRLAAPGARSVVVDDRPAGRGAARSRSPPPPAGGAATDAGAHPPPVAVASADPAPPPSEGGSFA